MNWKAELNELLKIKDAAARQAAIEAWWGLLPESEKEAIRDEVKAFMPTIKALQTGFAIVLEEMWEGISSWFSEWWENNPELRVYAALVAESQDGAAASSE